MEAHTVVGDLAVHFACKILKLDISLNAEFLNPEFLKLEILKLGISLNTELLNPGFLKLEILKPEDSLNPSPDHKVRSVDPNLIPEG